MVGPDQVLIAEQAGEEPLGLALAYPDWSTADAGRPARLVFKTLATAPWARRRGLGADLADRIHDLARQQGYREVVHALMHADNASLRLSERFGGRPFRRYGLYRWDAPGESGGG